MASLESRSRGLQSTVLVTAAIGGLHPAAAQEPWTAPIEVNYVHIGPAGELLASPDLVRDAAAFERVWAVGDKSVGTRWVSRPAGGGAPPAAGAAPPPRLPRGHGIDHWTDQDGLPANKVRSVLATSDGYLWVGTVGGLARFDGLGFTVFDAAAEPALADHGTIARAMHEDGDGRLWIATERGILCRYQGRFVSIDGADGLRGVTGNDLAARSRGGAWLAVDTGVYACTADGVTRLDAGGLAGAPRIVSVAEEPGANRLWVGAVGGLYSIDLDRGTATHFPTEVLPFSALDASSNLHHYRLHRDHAGKLWVLSTGGTVRFELPGRPASAPTEQASTPYRPAGSYAHYVRLESRRDGQPLRWAVDNLGDLVELGADGEPTATVDFRSADVMDLTRDRFGNLWIGTREGLFRLAWKPFAIAEVPAARNHESWRWVAEGAGGSIWIGNPWWVAQWSRESLTIFDSGSAPPSPFFYALGVSGGGRAWAGRFAGGIAPFPPSGIGVPGDARLAPLHPEVLDAWLVATRRDSGLWVATAGTVFPAGEDGSLGEPLHGSFGVPLALLEDTKGRLWVGAENGLFHKPATEGNATAGAIVPCPDVPGETRAVYEDREGAVWAAGSHGLSVLSDGGWRRLESGGLPFDRAFGIAGDATGHLWLQLQDEILRLPRTELRNGIAPTDLGWRIRRFGPEDGLGNAHAAGRFSRIVKAGDGRLWFATTRGVAVVDPGAVHDRPPLAAIRLGPVVAGAEPVAPQALSDRAPAGARDRLEFNFTLPELLEPTSIEFQFRLDGHDRDWRDAGSTRSASYTDLAAGSYAFRVRARHRHGIWGRDDAAVTFKLDRFFWERWTFWAGTGALAIGLPLTLTGWLRLRQARLLQDERAAAVDAERRRLAQDAHDHLGAHLARANLSSDPDSHRRMMAELDGIIWLQHPENDCVEGLVTFLLNFPDEYFVRTRKRGHVGRLPPVEFDIPVDLPNLPLSPDLRRNLAGIYKESLRNVAQHANATQVDVALRIDANQLLTLTVADDGAGFDPDATSAARSGHGLRNLIERSASLGGSIAVHSQPGEGTTVTATIPLRAAAARRTRLPNWLSRWLKTP